MSRLTWDNTGERTYRTGVDHGVLYVQAADGSYPQGVAWNGLSSVNETPSGGEANAVWADNMKYLNLTSAEEYGATIEAYTYPPEFNQCNGAGRVINGVYVTQQTRKQFGFVYRNKIGNDVLGDDYGYELHLIYNGKASPSEESHSTTNDSPEATTMSWELTTTAVALTSIDPSTGKQFKPTPALKINSTEIDPVHLKAIEDVLFGSEGSEPRLPSPDEVIALMNKAIEYTEVTPTGTENPAALGWYERSGAEGAYIYTLSADVTVNSEKTYYTAALAD